MFPLICAWIRGWVNNREAGDLRRHWAHYDVIVMDNTLYEECNWEKNNITHHIRFVILGPIYQTPYQRCDHRFSAFPKFWLFYKSKNSKYLEGINYIKYFFNHVQIKVQITNSSIVTLDPKLWPLFTTMGTWYIYNLGALVLRVSNMTTHQDAHFMILTMVEKTIYHWLRQWLGQAGDMPLSESVMTRILSPYGVTRPQWVDVDLEFTLYSLFRQGLAPYMYRWLTIAYTNYDQKFVGKWHNQATIS